MEMGGSGDPDVSFILSRIVGFVPGGRATPSYGQYGYVWPKGYSFYPICCSFSTWFGHDFSAGQFLSGRSFLIVTMT